MSSFFNILSLFLGLTAWILPIISIIKYKKGSNKNWHTFSILSMCACGMAIYFQILDINYLVNIEETITIMDTIGGIVSVSSVLLIVTILLNIISASKTMKQINNKAKS